MGQRIEFPSNGHTCQGYFAARASGKGPAVVVIQEWWGLVPHIEDVTNRFAAEGFCALAPDLYHGKTTKSPDATADKRCNSVKCEFDAQCPSLRHEQIAIKPRLRPFIPIKCRDQIAIIEAQH